MTSGEIIGRRVPKRHTILQVATGIRKEAVFIAICTVPGIAGQRDSDDDCYSNASIRQFPGFFHHFP